MNSRATGGPTTDDAPPQQLSTQDATVGQATAPLSDFSSKAASAAGTDLLMPPQYFPGDVTYQRDSRFTPISLGNLDSYVLLGSDVAFTYTLNENHPSGFVFTNADMEHRPRLGMVPVMHVFLRDSAIKGYKQAYRLRIRESFARQNVATAWYLLYVQRFGGMVSDLDHLEGGKHLWRSFVNTAALRGLKASLVDIATENWQAVRDDTPDSEIWSTDPSKRQLVLVLEKP